MKKPFLLIAGNKYYPSSRTGDWRGCFKTYEEAEEKLKEYDKEYDYDWYEIVDLREWTYDTDWVIRVEVASYSKTPLEILKYLAVDSVYGVRASVWNNPNCTEEIRLLTLSHKKYGHLVNRHTQSP